MPGSNNKKIIVAISGASGAIYARRLLDLLDQAGCQTHVIASAQARHILAQELSVIELTAQGILSRDSNHLVFHDNARLDSPLASGSVPTDGMVVCPCSSHSMAALAAGLANTLILRSAYVTLKQRRPLILVHREAPLTVIDLENMARLTRAGAIVYPASPAFYTAPKNIADLTDTVVGRVLDLLGINHNLPIGYQPK